MTLNYDSLEAYKQAIRIKFEEEKTKEYSSFLLVPSRARLRSLCVERLKDSSSEDDLKSFRLFFGFDFSVEKLNKLKDQTDKFRPIETFLKGETHLSDIEGLNVAAILVDFTPRPYKNYLIGNNSSNKEEVKALTLFDLKPKVITSNKSSKKKLVYLILSLIGILSVGYTAKNYIFSQKECMQWTVDHYESVECSSSKNSFAKIIEPYDAEKILLKKISICDTTTCWVGNRTLVWYCKVGGKPEFFNTHGIHPKTGKALKPITKYIFNKYVVNGK